MARSHSSKFILQRAGDTDNKSALCAIQISIKTLLYAERTTRVQQLDN